jgi:hypothetical protein
MAHMLLLDKSTYKQLLALLGEDPLLPCLPLQANSFSPNSTLLHLSTVQQENVLDTLSTLLQIKGITDGEINALGLAIEPLIDTISQGLYD